VPTEILKCRYKMSRRDILDIITYFSTIVRRPRNSRGKWDAILGERKKVTYESL
jgi:hypothetical protein